MSTVENQRIMIVEDNALIAGFISDSICAKGGKAVGPYHRIADAIRALDDESNLPDAALLDVNLDGTSFEIAARLRNHNIPFVFVTGHAADIPIEFRDVLLCAKPFTPSSLLNALGTAIGDRSLR
jgi:DNA-binding response OmpR family regulator